MTLRTKLLAMFLLLGVVPLLALGTLGYRRSTRALEDLLKALQLDPRHFDSYALLDFTLFQMGTPDKMMAYWNRFIELEPEHAKAYLERARYYFQQNDLPHSLADLKKSCDLGNQEACDRYNRHKDQWVN